MKESTGASGDGFKMMGAPAASAAPSFMAVMNRGTFHGTIPAATPTGTFCTRTGPMIPGRSCSNGNCSVRSANASRTEVEAKTWAKMANLDGAPISAVATAAISSERTCSPSDSARRNSARSFGLVAPQGPASAAVAASTARSTSVELASGTTATRR